MHYVVVHVMVGRQVPMRGWETVDWFVQQDKVTSYEQIYRMNYRLVKYISKVGSYIMLCVLATEMC